MRVYHPPASHTRITAPTLHLPSLLQDHVVFRYEASLLPPPGRKLISIDAGRRFVVSFFLADQTLAVFEPPQVGGMEGWRLCNAMQWLSSQGGSSSNPLHCICPTPSLPQPNTGITGGKFLERGRIYKPGSALEWFTVGAGAWGCS